jgi:hypothetical protein
MRSLAVGLVGNRFSPLCSLLTTMSCQFVDLIQLARLFTQLVEIQLVIAIGFISKHMKLGEFLLVQ